MNRQLSRLNVRKSSGPDKISPRLLKHCCDQLCSVLIFLIGRFSCVMWRTVLCDAIIFHVPKKKSISCLNDYRPVAMTSVVMKTFERLVFRHIKAFIPKDADPHQFVYRSVEDAIALCLHNTYEHLEPTRSKKQTSDKYVRIRFIDYSSAFNTIVPSKLFLKHLSCGLPCSLCNWLLNFLSQRRQVVRIGTNFSKPLVLNTGAPGLWIKPTVVFSLHIGLLCYVIQ